MTESEVKEMALKRLEYTAEQQQKIKPRWTLLLADRDSDILTAYLHGAKTSEIVAASKLSRQRINKILKKLDNRVDEA